MFLREKTRLSSVESFWRSATSWEKKPPHLRPPPSQQQSAVHAHIKDFQDLSQRDKRLVGDEQQTASPRHPPGCPPAGLRGGGAGVNPSRTLTHTPVKSSSNCPQKNFSSPRHGFLRPREGFNRASRRKGGEDKPLAKSMRRFGGLSSNPLSERVKQSAKFLLRRNPSLPVQPSTQRPAVARRLASQLRRRPPDTPTSISLTLGTFGCN